MIFDQISCSYLTPDLASLHRVICDVSGVGSSGDTVLSRCAVVAAAADARVGAMTHLTLP